MTITWTMPAKRKPGRPKGRADVVTFQVRLPPAIDEVLEKLTKFSLRSKNAEIIIAIKEAAKKCGLQVSDEEISDEV